VSDRSGSQRWCAAFPLDPRRRQPESEDENEERNLDASTYSANPDGDGLRLEVFIESNKESRVHGWHKEVKHPMVLVQHD
jgi:hypothetical protein